VTVNRRLIVRTLAALLPAAVLVGCSSESTTPPAASDTPPVAGGAPPTPKGAKAPRAVQRGVENQTGNKMVD
jgi:hypothetical protein